jgi:hypothetical protein
MRSDGAPAVATGSSSTLGIVQVDNSTITATAGTITVAQVPNPVVIGGSNNKIEYGSGPPTAQTAHGNGSLYLDQTNNILYMFYGAQTAPSLVSGQSVWMNNSFTGTLGASPTVGNYMIGFCAQDGAGGLPSVSAGWVSVGNFSKNAGNFYGLIVQRKVQGGDGATETPCGNLSGNRGGVLMEVTALSSSSFTSNVQFQLSTDSAGNSASETVTTTSANTLTLCFGMTGTSPSLSGSTWSNTVSGTQNSRSQIGGTNSATPNSSSVACSVNGSGQTTMVMQLTLQPNSAQITGWQPISNLNVIKNAGTQLTVNARTFNCSTGTTCTDDGAGNETITAAQGANTVPIASLATIAANTVLGNNSGSTATPAAQTSLSITGVTISGALSAVGTQPTLTGTCTTPTTKVGGATAGSFVTATGCSAQTVIISLPTATNGWICIASDQTTTTDSMKQSAQSASSCTLTGTTANNDVIVWEARAYLVDPCWLAPANDNYEPWWKREERCAA